ncbi:MAG: hypothetical protein DSO00_03555 [Archaeoglobi archaeon]|nr:MAG: hypothetical protein DSO00_03555 [Archaeoglobi archaeon]
MLIREDEPEYDVWVKISLSIAPTVIFLLLFLIRYNIIPSDTEYEAELGEKIPLTCLALILAAYWALLPRKYEIHDNN